MTEDRPKQWDQRQDGKDRPEVADKRAYTKRRLQTRANMTSRIDEHRL